MARCGSRTKSERLEPLGLTHLERALENERGLRVKPLIEKLSGLELEIQVDLKTRLIIFPLPFN
jgi:hypothetical protein